MAAVSCVSSEDEFLCSICLEVFTDPVTTPCGHSFCKICINKLWDRCLRYHCPMCKEEFSARPKLQISTCLSEVVSKFKKKRKRKAIDEQNVQCDICPEPKHKALKSCLMCQTSYCPDHLMPHNTAPGLKKHQLIAPVQNLEEIICPEHTQLLDMFCRDHSQLICVLCSSSDHKNHSTVPLKEQCEEEQSEVQQKIQERRKKIQELQRSVELSQKNADREMKEGEEFFNDLMKCVQESLDQFKQNINRKHQEIKEKTEELKKKLKTEISALKKRRKQMEAISSSNDNSFVVHAFTSVKAALELNDWTEVSVRAPSYEGRVVTAVSELQTKKLNPKIQKLFKDDLEKVKKHAVDVFLDPNTASPFLTVSEDHKQVHTTFPEPNVTSSTSEPKNVPDSPERFSAPLYVLSKEKFSSGKFYFEVQVKGKLGWCVGVGKESIDRKGNSERTPQNGYWILVWMCNTDNPSCAPEKVGVFVDYEEGLVCFFDAETSALIHFHADCCFTENLLPLFNPCSNIDGSNSAPLIITPVNV